MRTIILATALTVWAGIVAAQDVMRMAVTTSFHNSGLADVLLPAIAEDLGLEVQLLVVGTGQAIKLGQAGDVDAMTLFLSALPTTPPKRVRRQRHSPLCRPLPKQRQTLSAAGMTAVPTKKSLAFGSRQASPLTVSSLGTRLWELAWALR